MTTSLPHRWNEYESSLLAPKVFLSLNKHCLGSKIWSKTSFQCNADCKVVKGASWDLKYIRDSYVFSEELGTVKLV